MSRGPGRIEQRIGELFAVTKDRALSIGELAAHAFALGDGIAPDRKQRLSATRAAHRLLRRAAAAGQTLGAALQTLDAAFDQVIAETTATLGRGPGGRGRGGGHIFAVGSRFVVADLAFAEAMKNAPSWRAYQRAWAAYDREKKRFDGIPVSHRGGWRATEKDRRLWFHPADFPVRVWAVDIHPEGVIWAEAEIIRVDNTYVHVRYRGEPARLDRRKLARS